MKRIPFLGLLLLLSLPLAANGPGYGKIFTVQDLVIAIPPGTSGNVLTSNGSAWTSAGYTAHGTATPTAIQDGSAYTGTDTAIGTAWVAIPVTAAVTQDVGGFSVWLKRVGALTNTTGFVYGYIYSDSAGAPNVALGTGGQQTWGNVTTSYAEYHFACNKVSMVSGTTYWLVLQCSTPGGTVDLDSAALAGGVKTSSDGLSWSASTNLEYAHKLYPDTTGSQYALGQGLNYNGRGLYGWSALWEGVRGYSVSYCGTQGESYSYIGASGKSTYGPGVKGASTASYGVQGVSSSNYGVTGTSTSSSGVYGGSTSGPGVQGYSASDNALEACDSGGAALSGAKGSNGRWFETKRYNPDAPPPYGMYQTTPTLNFEFEGESLTGWTWHASSSFAHCNQTDYPGYLTIGNDNSAVEDHYQYDIWWAEFDVTMAIHYPSADHEGGIIGVHVLNSAGNGAGADLTYTSLAGNYYRFGHGDTSAWGSADIPTFSNYGAPGNVYLRVVRTSGSTVKSYCSFDGISWQYLYTGTLSGTATYLTIWVKWSVSSGTMARMAVDYLRANATIAPPP